MRIRSILGLAILLGIAACAWWALRPRPAGAGVASTSPDAATATTRLPPSSVLAIDMGRSSPRPAVLPRSAPATLAREYEQSRNLKALYDRISAAPQAAEAKYVLLRILGECARRRDPVPAGEPAIPTWEERRRKLEASLSDDNPQKAVRLKAFDEMRRCDGLEGLTTSRAELRKLVDDAARGGDPRARALQVQNELSDAAARSNGGPGGRGINDAQLQTLREAVVSGDPAAIVIAGTILSNTFGDLVIELGDQHQPLDNLAAYHAWNLLACEYGLDCGPGNNRLLQSCALAGRCGPANLADYLFFFETTPNQAQLIDRYRELFRHAIDGNDWSGLTFARRANPGDHAFYFYAQGP